MKPIFIDDDSLVGPLNWGFPIEMFRYFADGATSYRMSLATWRDGDLKQFGDVVGLKGIWWTVIWIFHRFKMIDLNIRMYYNVLDMREDNYVILPRWDDMMLFHDWPISWDYSGMIWLINLYWWYNIIYIITIHNGSNQLDPRETRNTNRSGGFSPHHRYCGWASEILSWKRW